MAPVASTDSVESAPPCDVTGVLRRHLWFVLPVLLYAGFGYLVTWWLGLDGRMSLSLYAAGVWKVFLLTAFLFVLVYPVYVMIVRRPRALIRHMAHDLRTNLLTPERLLSGLIMLAVLPVFISVFTSFKIMIPVIQPYDWDPQFMAWDRMLHGGRHPWELLQPLIGRPLITSAINAAYHAWFFLLYAIVFWQAFSIGNQALRTQFFLCFLLCWAVIGNGAATLLASAGPCYYGALTGLEDPYAPLMAYLREAAESYPVWALGVQEMLWEGYETNLLGRGNGISAMPSMHVSAAVLFFLVCRRVDRRLGWFMAAFVGVTLVGSVHLGWHYAIDGYVSILLTWPLWRLAGWLAQPRRRGGHAGALAQEAAP